MTEPLRIALIGRQSADDVRAWSGTPFFEKRALAKHLGDVVDLSPANVNPLPYKIANALLKKLSGRHSSWDHFKGYARRVGRYFSEALKREDYDLVFVPGGIECIAWLETDIPILYYSDATWHLVRNYYKVFSNPPKWADRNADDMERASLQKSELVFLPSHWAAESAVDDYGVDPDRVHTLYLGANLVNPPSRTSILPRELGESIRLLLVGVSWEIKGGSVALDVLKELLARGYDAQLTVVGCAAPDGVSHPRMEVIPFLNKQIPRERTRFEEAWHNADFFILPSRHEAAGLVFCEASAHGLPILAARTGGIPSLVVDGKNGYTIAHDDEPAGYVEKIVEIVNDPIRYTELCESARDEYETRLNWDVWGGEVARVVGERFPEFRERIGKYREGMSGRSRS